MSKLLTQNAHWQARTASFSTHASRKGVNLLNWDAGVEEHMTPEQERDCLARKVKQLNEFMRDHKAAMSKAERTQYGNEISKLCVRINHLRPKMRTPGIERYIIDILRERMSRLEFNALFAEAKRRYAAEHNAQRQADQEAA